jgi:hypothetical protein
MKRCSKRQQCVEFGGIVADTVGRCDEDLPALLCESPSLGDRDDNTQPDRRCVILTSRCVHNEGHGNTSLARCIPGRHAFVISVLAISVPAISVPAICTPGASIPTKRVSCRVGPLVRQACSIVGQRRPRRERRARRNSAVPTAALLVGTADLASWINRYVGAALPTLQRCVNSIVYGRQTRDFERVSRDNPFSKSSKACLPAS